MPAIMEQVSRLSVSEKLDLMDRIIKSISFSLPEQTGGIRKRRIGLMDGKWKLPTWEEDKAIDREIEADFEASLERRMACHP